MGKSVLPFLVVEALTKSGFVFLDSPARGTEEWLKGKKLLRMTPSPNHPDRLVWVLENKLTGDQKLDAGVIKALCDFVVSQ